MQMRGSGFEANKKKLEHIRCKVLIKYSKLCLKVPIQNPCQNIKMTIQYVRIKYLKYRPEKYIYLLLKI